MIPFKDWDRLDYSRSRHRSSAGQSREEQIAAFNKKAQQCKRETKLGISTTLNFQGKPISRVPHSSLSHLKPIAIEELQTGVTHLSRVLYARIVSQAMCMTSVMVLIGDQTGQGIANLAVYGLSDSTIMREDRCLAIIEPHYKIRNDGTPGIRVDTLDDIVWDATVESVAQKKSAGNIESDVGSEDEIVTLESRLQQIFISDPNLGVYRAFHKVTSEGFNATKKQVRALKKTILEYKDGGSTQPRSLVPILAERRPENHRLFDTAAILAQRGDGKKAFERGDYEAAEGYFSRAITLTKTEPPVLEATGTQMVDAVALWQLIGNRSAARYKLGKLDEALQDAMLSHRCAPIEAIKPIFRCVETMTVLGMLEDAKQLLEEASVVFPDYKSEILGRKTRLCPKQLLKVGPDKHYRTIFGALRDAQSGAEILVDPGVYTEALILTKPVTLRSSKEILVSDTLSEEGIGPSGSSRPEIRVHGYSAVICNTKPIDRPVCIVGFTVACHDVPLNSFHALDVRSGLVVVRNTILTSSSGPVVCLQDRPLQPLSPIVRPISSEKPSRLILHSCKVHSGAQGGILGADKSTLTLRQVHVTGNAACGLELREGCSAQVVNCYFYGNDRQGIMMWKSSGCLDAKHCWIHSHAEESGALVSEGEAFFESCEFYGNGAAGVVTQQRGFMHLYKCMVHDNCEGILIQDTGSAIVEKCDVFRNRANGIFIGYDHRGDATIRENMVCENVSRGILVGNKGQNVRVSKNTERDNKGSPMRMPGFMRERFNPSKKHRKLLKKNKSTIEQAMKEQKPTGGILDFVSDKFAPKLFETTESMDKNCMYCGKSPPKDRCFPRCAKCKAISYCSQTCQRKDWPRHKIGCRSSNIKYPMFINPDKSVNDPPLK